MEILSIGEKIRRARIYQGLTLKDVCNNKISISKLSFIENNKIIPDEDLLRYLADKFNVDYEYLKKDERQQIIENFEALKKSKNDDEYEKNIKDCLKCAKNNKFYDIEFDIIHDAFTYFIKKGKSEEIQKIICEYYYLNKYAKIKEKNRYLHYIDMAIYYYMNNELIQCTNYCNLIIENKQKKNLKTNILIDALYYKCLCYIEMKKYVQALDITEELLKLIHDVDDNAKKADIYKTTAGLCLRVNSKEFEKYASLSLKYAYHNKDKSQILLYYSDVMFDVGFYNKALEYIEKSIKMYKNKNKNEYVKFLTYVIQILLKNNILDKFCDLYDKLTDYSIEIDDPKLIENAYYLKGLMALKKGDYDNAELYMSLSLDFLNKIKDKNKLFNRYIELGYLYYKLNNAKQALNYYSLAIRLNDKYFND